MNGVWVRDDGSAPQAWEPGIEQDKNPVLTFRCPGGMRVGLEVTRVESESGGRKAERHS